MYTPFFITHLQPIFWFFTIRFEWSWGSFHTKLSLCCQMGRPYSYVKKKILIVSLRKGLALHLTNVNFLPQRILCAKFGLNWLSVSREDIKKEKKNKKSYIQTDARQKVIIIAHSNFQLRWAKIKRDSKRQINTNFYLIILTKAYCLVKIYLVNSESTRLPFRGTDMTIFWTAHGDLQIGNTVGDKYLAFNDFHTFDTMWPKPKRTFIRRPDKFY